MCTNSAEIIQHNKEAKNTREEVEKYFPGFMALEHPQSSRYQDL